jgi:hypothetical protein
VNILGAVLSRMYRDVPRKVYGVNTVQNCRVSQHFLKLEVNRGINLLVCERLTEVRTLYSMSQGCHDGPRHCFCVSPLIYARHECVLYPVVTIFLPEFGIMNLSVIRCGRRRIRFGGHRSE